LCLGPEGIRDYLRSVLSLSYSRIAVPHIIHELKNIPFLHGSFQKRFSSEGNIRTQFSPQFGEVKLGSDIFPNDQVCIL
jgi:hypothetical protein